MPRMKIVRKDVAHVWTHKLQSEARTPGSGNLYFEGDTIYSYGSHFPIARHVHVKRTGDIVLFTTREYSSTTSGHKREVRGAIPSTLPVVFCKDVKADSKSEHLENITDMLTDAASSLDKARHANSRALSHLNDYRSLIARADHYAKLFKVRYVKPKVPKDLPELNTRAERLRQAANIRYVQRDEKRRLRELAQREIDAKEYQEKLAAWLAGEVNVRLPHGGSDVDYLRISPTEDKPQVETSRQAFVETDAVVKILPLVLDILAKGKTYKRNGHTIHVGEYPLEEITSDGLVIVGCHRFTRAEVERFAGVLRELKVNV